MDAEEIRSTMELHGLPVRKDTPLCNEHVLKWETCDGCISEKNCKIYCAILEIIVERG